MLDLRVVFEVVVFASLMNLVFPGAEPYLKSKQDATQLSPMCPDEPQRCVFVLTEAQSARAVRVCLLGSPLFLCVLSLLSLIRGLLDIITLLPCLLKKISVSMQFPVGPTCSSQRGLPHAMPVVQASLIKAYSCCQLGNNHYSNTTQI